MADTNKISCEVGRGRWNCLGHSGEKVWTTFLRYWGGHQNVEGREADQRPVGDELLKEEKGKSWIVAGAATRNRGVGRTMWRPYVPTGPTSNDDDNDDDDTHYTWQLTLIYVRKIGNKNKFREKVYRTSGVHFTLSPQILSLFVINVHHVTNFQRSLLKPITLIITSPISILT